MKKQTKGQFAMLAILAGLGVFVLLRISGGSQMSSLAEDAGLNIVNKRSKKKNKNNEEEIPFVGRTLELCCPEESAGLVRTEKISLAEAARKVAAADPLRCGNCTQHNFWQLDEVGPQEIMGKTHYLQSIPNEYRLPQLDQSNFSMHFKNESRWMVNRTYYFEYNPSIIPLPRIQTPLHLRRNESNGQEDYQYYLAGYRVSIVQACLSEAQYDEAHYKVRNIPEQFALAILDANLDVVREVTFSHSVRDIRLFQINCKLYMGYYNTIVQFWIEPSAISNSTHAGIQMMKRKKFGASSEQDFDLYMAPKQELCCRSHTCGGKNFNYFTSSKSQVFVETSPMSPRIVEETVTGEKLCEKRPNNMKPKDLSLVRNNSRVHVSTDTPPGESFRTIDAPYFAEHGVYPPPYTEERGTACCIRIPDPRSDSLDQPHLLVGVSHVKIPMFGDNVAGFRKKFNLDFEGRQYSSRFYAFEPHPPFQMVALTGSFCLGYPSDSEGYHPYKWFLRNLPFKLGSRMACPYITFISGISESIDDPNQVVIGYGMNDCASRLIKVAKAEIERMLFPSSSNN